MKSPVMEAGGPKLASAIVAGSKEANNAILRPGWRPTQAKGPAEATAKNTAKMVELLGKIGGAIGAEAVRLGGREIAFAAMAGNF